MWDLLTTTADVNFNIFYYLLLVSPVLGKSLPLNLYEGLHDRIVSLPAVNQQPHSLELPLDGADESLGLPFAI